MKLENILDKEIFKIIKLAGENINNNVYVIGGFVRDFYLRRSDMQDIDILVIGSGIELAKEISVMLNNKSKVQYFKNFGTAMIKINDTEIEIVGARKESYRANSRKPIVENGTLKDDQERRDFTINALAWSLNKADFGELIDPFGGMDDLENKIIKTPLDPDKTYSDDPLRMLRAIRFAAQLNFKIEENSFQSIKRNAERIKIISDERVSLELSKIMLCEKPSIGLELLEKSGLMKLILHEVSDLKGVDKVEGKSHKDNFYHTLEVVDNISLRSNDLWLRWSALLHDIGKASTKSFDKEIGWTFHGHEFRGMKMVSKIFRRLKLPLGSELKFVEKMVLMSSRPIVISEEEVTDSAVRRLLFDSGNDIESLMQLCEADITTKNIERMNRYKNNLKIVRKKLEEVEEKDKLRNWQPPISGELIMKTFDILPSKEVGKIKLAIREAILDGKISNNFDQAFNFMLKAGRELGLTTC